MTPENFAFWLQGFFELGNVSELTKEQVSSIKEHLKLVFDKQTSDLYKLPGTFMDHSGDTQARPEWAYRAYLGPTYCDNVNGGHVNTVSTIKPTISC